MKYLFVFILALVPLTFASAAGQSTSHKGHTSSEMSSGHDAHYLESFSAHHRDGIEMAKLAEKKARDPQLRKMASKIIKDQNEELNQMQMWKEKFFSNVQSEEEAPKKMDMSKLQEAQGKEFDARFAEMMAKHHQDGIKMTKEMLPQLQQEDVKRFAEKSITKQTEEIQKLKNLSKKAEKQS